MHAAKTLSARIGAALLVALAWLWPGAGGAAVCTYYVRAGNAPGETPDGKTPASAFGSIGAAAAALMNNDDIVCVGPGTYAEGNITPGRSGIPGHPIEFRADPSGESTGDPPGDAISVVPPSEACGNPDVPSVAFLLPGRHDVIIQGFTIKGFCDAAIQVRSNNIYAADAVEGGYVADNNAHDVTLRDNVVQGNKKLGIDVNAGGMIVVEGNQALDNGDSGISVQSCVGVPVPEPGIDPPPRCRAGPGEPVVPVVSNNRTDGNGAHGIFIAQAEDGIVQNNIVSDNTSTGITLRAAPDFAVANNLVVRNGLEGLAVGSADLPSPNARVVSNTFFGNGQWGVEIGSGGAASPGALVLDNILQGNGAGLLGIGVLNENASPLGPPSSTCGYVAGFNLTLDDYGPKTPRNIYDLHDDPSFVDATAGDFHLRPGSPAIDAGSDSAAVLGITGSATADGSRDAGRVDLGFHYGAEPTQVLVAKEPFMPVYVRATGDDTDEGKAPGAALLTIAAGARRARAGVSVVVGPGVYPECNLHPEPDQGKASFLADATGRRTGDPAGPVLVDAAACTNPGGSSDGAGFDVPSSCFVVVDGFHVRSAPDDGIKVQTGSHFAVIRNNASFSNRRRGINVVNARDVQIVNNLAYDNQGGGIQIGGDQGACSDDQVLSGDCRTLAGSPRAIIQSNTSYANGFTGILIGAGGSNGGISSHASVRYNVLVANGENGIQVGNADSRSENLDGFAERSGFNVLWGNPSPYGAGTPVLASDRRENPLLVDPAGDDHMLGGDNFADDNFCLSQIAAGQAEQARNVIDYSDVSATKAGMIGRSTRTDRVADRGNLDPGYHSLAELVGLVGDCDEDGRVAIHELILGTRIALGEASIAECPNLDADFSGRATIDELVTAVSGAVEARN